MLDRKIHKFRLSFRLESNIYLEWLEGINVHQAKAKLQLKYPKATNILDWTYENPEDLENYLSKNSEVMQ